MTDTDVPPSPCLHCGRELDAAMALEGVPEPGDVTICVKCGHIMVFANDMTLRNPTDAEMYDIAGDRRIVQAQRVLAEFKQRERGK